MEQQPPAADSTSAVPPAGELQRQTPAQRNVTPPAAAPSTVPAATTAAARASRAAGPCRDPRAPDQAPEPITPAAKPAPPGGAARNRSPRSRAKRSAAAGRARGRAVGGPHARDLGRADPPAYGEGRGGRGSRGAGRVSPRVPGLPAPARPRALTPSRGWGRFKRRVQHEGARHATLATGARRARPFRHQRGHRCPGCRRPAPRRCGDQPRDRPAHAHLSASGRLYVAGAPGERYAVHVANRTGGRVMAVVSVDGINAVTGETASPDQNGYVLAAHQSFEITGWRKSASEVAAFYFTQLPDSYAARTDRPDHVGVIGVAVFREWQPPRPAALPHAAPARRMRSDNAAREAESAAADSRRTAGGHGFGRGPERRGAARTAPAGEDRHRPRRARAFGRGLHAVPPRDDPAERDHRDPLRHARKPARARDHFAALADRDAEPVPRRAVRSGSAVLIDARRRKAASTTGVPETRRARAGGAPRRRARGPAPMRSSRA